MKGKSFAYPHTTLLRVIDGDTIEVKIDFGMRIFTEQCIRLYGIQAPELRKTGGIEAKLFLETLIPATDCFELITFKPVLGNRDKKEKYGRYLGLIKIPSSLEIVNDTMVKHGHAIRKVY
jgi:micrococcal nuclease